MVPLDKKEFLKAKVRTNGFVNLGRAVNAAKLTLTMGVDAAIQTSNVNIADVVVTEEKINFNPELITPIALPSMFK